MTLSAWVSRRDGRPPSSTSSRCQRSPRTSVASAVEQHGAERGEPLAGVLRQPRRRLVRRPPDDARDARRARRRRRPTTRASRAGGAGRRRRARAAAAARAAAMRGRACSMAADDGGRPGSHSCSCPSPARSPCPDDAGRLGAARLRAGRAPVGEVAARARRRGSSSSASRAWLAERPDGLALVARRAGARRAGHAPQRRAGRRPRRGAHRRHGPHARGAGGGRARAAPHARAARGARPAGVPPPRHADPRGRRGGGDAAALWGVRRGRRPDARRARRRCVGDAARRRPARAPDRDRAARGRPADARWRS